MVETDKEKSFWNRMTFKEKCHYLWNNITVEPLLAGFVLPSMLTNLGTQNLNLEKACRVNLDFNSTVCDALSMRQTTNFTNEEKEVQRLVAGMSGYRTAIQSGLPCLIILFWGSWSDRHQRRKPCILFPLIGELLSACGLLLCVYLERTPVELAVFMEVIFPGLTGGWFTMFMGIYSYIADITSEEERTLRIGLVSLCFQISVPIGTSVSGILLKTIGFYGVYSVSATLYLLTFIYGAFYLKEVPFNEERQHDIDKSKSAIADFFDRKHVYNTFRIAFVNGKNRRRIKIIMVMIVVMVVIGPLLGEGTVFYLFTRYRFNWSEIEFSIFCTYSIVVCTIGTFISVGVLSTIFKVDDTIIGVLSSLSKILAGVVYAFAYYEWHMYVAALVDILNGTSFISMRSIASKLVSSDELGKVNSLFGAAESVAPMIYAPLYASVYAATLTVLPGAFFLLGGVMTIPAVIIFLWLYRVQRKEKKEAAIPGTEKRNSELPQISIITKGAVNMPS